MGDQRVGRAGRGARERSRALAGALALLVALTFALSACSVPGLPVGSSGGSGVTIAVTVKEDGSGSTLVYLPITIKGRGPYTFIVDTGASVSTVDAPIAAQLNLQQVGSPQPVAGVGGQTEATPIRVNSWSAEQLRLPTATITSVNLFQGERGDGARGLLGSDIWRRFGSVTINYSAQTLTVSRQIA